jgi:hypothetical protein
LYFTVGIQGRSPSSSAARTSSAVVSRCACPRITTLQASVSLYSSTSNRTSSLIVSSVSLLPSAVRKTTLSPSTM